MDEVLRELDEVIAQALQKRRVHSVQDRGELTLHINASDLLDVMRWLHDDAATGFTMLMDVTAVDWLQRDPRFELVYHLLSPTLNARLRVKVPVDEETLVESVTGIWASANWPEREVWDMYGILFANHPDLRRILTDYGFEGHPLRKDFPLTGYSQVRYSETDKQVIYEPVSLTQEYRSFDFASPWEGMSGPARDGQPDDPNAGAA